MPRFPLLPLLRAGALVAAGALLFYAPRRRSEPPEEELIWAADILEWAPGVLRLGQKATGPLPGQKTPPCAPRVEREVAGACWEPHLERPPCPAGYFEGAGMCLKPVRMAKRPPTSVTP